MKTYEICNPSDPYFLKAEDFLNAAAAVILIGQGAYPLLDGDKAVVPPFFAGDDFDGWWEEKSPGVNFGDYCRNEREAIIQVLDTVAMPEGHERTSLNNIRSKAEAYMEALRKIEGEPNE